MSRVFEYTYLQEEKRTLMAESLQDAAKLVHQIKSSSRGMIPLQLNEIHLELLTTPKTPTSA